MQAWHNLYKPDNLYKRDMIYTSLTWPVQAWHDLCKPYKTDIIQTL